MTTKVGISPFIQHPEANPNHSPKFVSLVSHSAGAGHALMVKILQANGLEDYAHTIETSDPAHRKDMVEHWIVRAGPIPAKAMPAKLIIDV
jgi:hypothetical protein